MASLAETIRGKKFTSVLEECFVSPGGFMRNPQVHSDGQPWLDVRDGRIFIKSAHKANALEFQFLVDCLREMDTPLVCTIEEVGQEFLDFLLNTQSDVNEAIRLFRERLEARCNWLHYSDPIAVATGPFARVLEDVPITLWEGHSDFRIELVGSLPAPSRTSQDEKKSEALQTLYVVTRGVTRRDARTCR